MNDTRVLNKQYESFAWGAFFIWLGVSSLFRFPNGTNLVGIGLILLAVNAARYFSHLHVNSFTVTLGVLALVLGAADLLRALNLVTADVPALPLLMIALGMVWLIQGIRRGAR